ncbi:MAG TPA: ester cyclase [Ktedonosporobacter sp.]|nr:ester cyclase [Ktedonosporobacter sp.]
MQDIKVAYRQFMEELFNQRDLSAVDRYVDPNQINHHLYPGQKEGSEGVKQTATTLLQAFPDLHMTIDEIVQREDTLVIVWTMQGTQKGTLFGMPPSGNQATWTGIDSVRFSNGKVAERWGQHDALSMAKQLGVDVRKAEHSARSMTQPSSVAQESV